LNEALKQGTEEAQAKGTELLKQIKNLQMELEWVNKSQLLLWQWTASWSIQTILSSEIASMCITGRNSDEIITSQQRYVNQLCET
jgi:hypothetical protein